jgi:hypothetical protein
MQEELLTPTALRRCRIYYIAAGQVVSWGWRADDGRARSSQLFPLFYECVEDARGHGYYVDLDRTPENAVTRPAATVSA